MMQSPLFFESENDALAHVVSVLGGAKKVGTLLRPELAADAAGRWVLDCLNAERPAQFHPPQVMYLLRAARAVGDHAAMAWWAGECGYQALPIEPQDEAAELKRRFIESADLLARMARRIEQLEGPSMTMRAVP
ncbi:hypothetical protein [Sulfuriferula sp.]|uniref:hypothetical protein n=1 Tax=Sulfuriferula sp. TaxID=2025307 RepID=UPI00272FE2E2|nr:hypothetical protein [Sulfuriferula sp.]MDP2026429.1 hypothetical protein [Sulfuriferula sp.]